MSFFDDVIDGVFEGIEAIWDFISHWFIQLLNFVDNIVSFFQDPTRKQKLLADKNKIAVSIKENLNNGNFNVVNCLFDQEAGEIVDYDAETYEAEKLDASTRQNFGNKKMIVLK